jgi:hypothetical protein
MLHLLKAREDRAEDFRARDAIGSKLDWGYIVKTARQGAFAGLLFSALRDSALQDRVPQQALRDLARTYYLTGLSNARQREELERVLSALEQTGIETLLLKGAALLAEIPKLRRTRCMADIDLMVHEKDLLRSDSVLQGLGYVSSEGYKTKEQYLRNHHHLAPYVRPGTDFKVEIHRSIVPVDAPFRLDTDQLWARARRLKNGGREVRALSANDTLIYLCLHLSWAHAFTGAMRCFTDIASFLPCQGQSVDWGAILETARKGRFGAYLYYPLFFADRTLDLRLPESALNELKAQSHLRRLEDRLLKLLIQRYRILENDSSSFLPPWLLEKLYTELLRPAPVHKKLLSIFGIAIGPGPQPESGSTQGDSSRFTAFLHRGHRLLRLPLRFATRVNEVIMKRAFSRTA